MKLIVNNKKKDIELLKAAKRQFQMRCGAFFREKRVKCDKTEKEVADFLKISVETVRCYENGEEAIPLNRVDALSSFLKIPLEEIMELHLDLEKKLLPKQNFEQPSFEKRNVGRLVRQARKTVFLSTKNLAQLLSRSGHVISESEIMHIEAGKKEASIDFWLKFCVLIHLHEDAIRGYSRSEHLSRLSIAFKNDQMRIPVGSKLLNALENYHSATEANKHKYLYLLKFSMAFRKKWKRRG